MAGSQKITLWGPQRTPLGILRVKKQTNINKIKQDSYWGAFQKHCCRGKQRILHIPSVCL